MFRLTCVLGAVLCVALFPLLLINAGFYVDTYGVAADTGAAFMGRRASPMFLGLAVLLWMVRDLDPGPARDAVCASMVVIWAGIAITGLYELMIGTAGPLIAGAAVVELGFAVAFWRSRNQPSRIS